MSLHNSSGGGRHLGAPNNFTTSDVVMNKQMAQALGQPEPKFTTEQMLPPYQDDEPKVTGQSFEIEPSPYHQQKEKSLKSGRSRKIDDGGSHKSIMSVEKISQNSR